MIPIGDVVDEAKGVEWLRIHGDAALAVGVDRVVEKMP
jgi:hypothetical protein